MLHKRSDDIDVWVVVKPIRKAVRSRKRVDRRSSEVRFAVNWEVDVDLIVFQYFGDGLCISVLHRARELRFDWQVGLDRIESGRRRDEKQQADKLEHFLL